MYIEFVIADNFLLTYLAGRAAGRTGKSGTGRLRTVIAAFIGTAVAVVYPLMPQNTALRATVKPLLWITLSVIMFYKKPRAIICGLLFLGYTLAFGGASLAFGLMIYGDIDAAQSFSARCPLFLTLGAATAVFVFAEYCSKKVWVKRANEPYEYRLDIELFGESLSFSAFLDTGNCVTDSVSGLPVVITDAASLTKKLGASGAIELCKALPRMRRADIKTAAGRAEIYVIKPTSMTVYSDKTAHKINAMIGVVGEGMSFSAAYEMLLNPLAIAEGI